MNKTVLAIITLVIIVFVGWWLFNSSPAVPTTTATPTSTASVATTSPDASIGQPETVTITGSEFKYDPNTISAQVGQPVTVVYKNIGQYPHNFVINELGVKSPTIGPGQTETFSFTPDKSGTFSFYCSLPGHRDKGMEGTISVN